MDYKKIYNTLILRGQNRTLTGYIERHHILPRCLGGNDSATNIVKLTAREHFIAHLLLTKIYPHESGVFYAVNMMTMKSTEHRSRNRLYGALRQKLAEIMSEDRKGDKNHFFGKTHTQETKSKISIRAKERPAPTQETIDKIIESRKGFKPSKESRQQAVNTRRENTDKWHTPETILKIKESKKLISSETKSKISKSNRGRTQSNEEREMRARIKKGTGLGENNPMFGKIFITNGIVNKVIDPNNLQDWIATGWYKGRTQLH